MTITKIDNLFKLINNKLWGILFLFLMPAFWIISTFKIANVRGYYWLGINYDPDYPYLFNALNIANLKTPGHTDHPGTTLQILGAIVLKISYFIESIFNPSLETLNETVVNNPEKYLTLINITILLIIVCLVFLVGLISFVYFQNVSLSLILQITPFLNLATWQALNKVSPEPLLFGMSQMLVILLLIYLRKQNAEKSQWFAIALGIILGLGLATKVTFIPLIILLIVIPQIRLKFLALFTLVLTFIIATLPIASKYQITLKWLTSIATHTGKYGQGDPGFIETTAIWSNINWLISSEKIFFSLVIISTFVLGIVFLLERRNNWDREAEIKNLSVRKSTLLFSLIIVIFWLQILLTIKHPGIHYLIPSMGLCGLLIFIQVVYLPSLIKHFRFTKSELVTKFFPPTALAVCIGLSVQQFPIYFQTIASIYSIHNQDNKTIQNIIDEKYSNCLKVTYYGASSKEYALQFANNYSANNFSTYLIELYPNEIFYSLWASKYSSYVELLQDLNFVNRECVIFRGLKLGGEDMSKEYYVPNVTLKPIFIGTSEALYEAISYNYNVDEDIYFTRQGNTSQAAIYQKSGWSQAEEWGTWTDGKEASLLLKINSIPAKNLELIADVNPFVSDKHPQQNIDILVNQTAVGSWTFRYGEPNSPQKIFIPAELISDRNILEITFRLNDAKSPAELNINSDRRLLGLGFKKIRIVPSQN